MQKEWYSLVLHQYGILPIIQLADIRIHTFTNTNNWSDGYISHEFDKMVISKHYYGLFLVYIL